MKFNKYTSTKYSTLVLAKAIIQQKEYFNICNDASREAGIKKSTDLAYGLGLVGNIFGYGKAYHYQ